MLGMALPPAGHQVPRFQSATEKLRLGTTRPGRLEPICPSLGAFRSSRAPLLRKSGNKFADSLVIGFFPLYFLQHRLTLLQVGLLVGVYAWVWGVGQVATGALADKIGRRLPIAAGIFGIGAGVLLTQVTSGLGAWLLDAALMGVGMALVYPNLISSVGDVAAPTWRGGALGVYRLWRDGGYAIGPVVLGVVAALFGLSAAFWTIAVVMGLSGLAIVALMRETDPRLRTAPPVWEGHPEWIYGPRGASSAPRDV